MTFSRLLRISRLRTGLTFREAHKITIQIAGLLKNRDYAISTGLLSDYEAVNKLPRHTAKIITLCVIYGIDPLELLKAAGIHIEDSAKRPLLLPQELARKNAGRAPDHVGHVGAACQRWEGRRNRYSARSLGASA